MLPNYIKDLLNLEDVIITKIVHADKSVKFFLDTKPKPHFVQTAGTPQLRSTIIAGRRSKIYHFS